MGTKTIGEQAREFRIAKGWSPAKMAEEVGTSRQNIESLEATGNRVPRSYINGLAKVLNKSVDAILYDAGMLDAGTATWPFDRALYDRFMALKERDRGIVEGRLIAAIEEREDPSAKVRALDRRTDPLLKQPTKAVKKLTRENKRLR